MESSFIFNQLLRAPRALRRLLLSEQKRETGEVDGILEKNKRDDVSPENECSEPQVTPYRTLRLGSIAVQTILSWVSNCRRAVRVGTQWHRTCPRCPGIHAFLTAEADHQEP
jgi:hypothetical protein